jgi:hypothetical protein
MNKVLELLLIVVALAALYCAIPTSVPSPGHSAIRADQTVLVADGSDPMPACRKITCTP